MMLDVLAGSVSFLIVAWGIEQLSYAYVNFRPSLTRQLIHQLPAIAKELKIDKQEDGSVKIKFGDNG